VFTGQPSTATWNTTASAPGRDDLTRLVQAELAWQRRLLAALLKSHPRPGWAIAATCRRIEGLGAALLSLKSI